MIQFAAFALKFRFECSLTKRFEQNFKEVALLFKKICFIAFVVVIGIVCGVLQGVNCLVTAGYGYELRVASADMEILCRPLRAADIIGLPQPEPPKPEVLAEPVSPTPVTEITEDHELLARALYQEAGSSKISDHTKRRTGDVILNRVEDPRFPNSIREVLTARRQYGRYYWTGVIWPAKAKNPSEQAAVKKCYDIAADLLYHGRHSDLYRRGYVWQAEFRQGRDIIADSGIYFGR